MIDIKELVKYSKNLKVLYVEDDKEARTSIVEFLKNFFSDLQVAVDGEDGLDKFNQYKFDLIITDINMPKLNGFEMIKIIRELDKEISILILSAYDDKNNLSQGIKLSVDGYLLKPIDNKQFIDVLLKMVTNYKNKIDNEANAVILEQYKNITNQSTIISKTDTKGRITFVNDKFTKLYQYTKDELVGKTHHLIKHPNNPDSTYKDLWRTVKSEKKVWKGQLRNISKDGVSHYLQMTIEPILDKDGNILEYISLQTDITKIMNPKKQLENLIDTADNIFAFMIEIEDFNDIQDLYGESIARKIDNELADILEVTTPDKYNFEKVFVLGEGKYIFATQINSFNIEEITKELKKYQNQINTIKLNVKEDIQYDISVIISISYGDHILENLTYGINKLKETKSTFIDSSGLSESVHKTAQKNMETISMIKTAIETNNIVSYFQPIVNNKTKEIVKYESLVRLIDKDKKVLSPFFFLDISKKGKYYSQITNIVLKNSFAILSKVNKDISINISAIDIELISTQEYIFSFLEKYKEFTNRVIFELLEDEGVKDFKTIVAFINKAKSYGVKIAIDDFGAGYSNFERLLDYQPDILKIDGCLIKNILEDSYSLSIVKTIVSFAKEQNIETVAEFVEDEKTYILLKNMGIDFTQGYYFGKPMPIELV